MPGLSMHEYAVRQAGVLTTTLSPDPEVASIFYVMLIRYFIEATPLVTLPNTGMYTVLNVHSSRTASCKRKMCVKIRTRQARLLGATMRKKKLELLGKG